MSSARSGPRGHAVLVWALLAGAVVLVAVTDATADRLLMWVDTDTAWRVHAAVATGGRVLGGWAVGMALRLHLLGGGRPVKGASPWLRWGAAVPLAAICGWPLVIGPGVQGMAAWGDGELVLGLGSFAGVVLGLVVAQGVEVGGRRRTS